MSIGEQLKAARERKRLTIEEVAKATKIHRNTLTALEADSADALLNPVYVKNFIKTYAKYLGEDGQALARAYAPPKLPTTRMTALTRPAQVPASAPVKNAAPVLPRPTLRPRVEPARPAVRSAPRWEMPKVTIPRVTLPKIRLPNMAWPIVKMPKLTLPQIQRETVGGGLLLLLAVLGLVALSRIKITAGQSKPAVKRAAAPAAPAVKPAAAATPVAAPAAAAASTRRMNFTIPKTQPLRLLIQAKEPSWLQVKSDGKVVFQNVLVPGQKEKWEAKTQLDLWVGNAGGIMLVVNSVDLGVLGKRGQVLKNIAITRDGATVTP